MNWIELTEVRATLDCIYVLVLWPEVSVPKVIRPIHATGSLQSSASKVLINASDYWLLGNRQPVD
jgi:hypothetical protein